MITNKNVCKIYQSILYLTFSLLQFIDAFVAIGSVIFVDTVSITDIISSHAITEVSVILFKFLLSAQIHFLGLQL